MRTLLPALALISLLPVVSLGTTIQFTTSLAGYLENPANVSPGSGTALVTYDDLVHTLVIHAEFSGLVAGTSVAHIHCCVDPPGNVGVASYPGTFPGFPVGVTSGTYDSPTPIDLTLTSSYTAGFLSGFGGGTAAGAEAALRTGMLGGRAYFNIHSSTFPAGEIRGFLTATPEPTTFYLVGGALLVAAAYRLRRKRA